MGSLTQKAAELRQERLQKIAAHLPSVRELQKTAGRVGWSSERLREIVRTFRPEKLDALDWAESLDRLRQRKEANAFGRLIRVLANSGSKGQSQAVEEFVKKAPGIAVPDMNPNNLRQMTLTDRQGVSHTFFDSPAHHAHHFVSGRMADVTPVGEVYLRTGSPDAMGAQKIYQKARDSIGASLPGGTPVTAHGSRQPPTEPRTLAMYTHLIDGSVAPGARPVIVSTDRLFVGDGLHTVPHEVRHLETWYRALAQNIKDNRVVGGHKHLLGQNGHIEVNTKGAFQRLAIEADANFHVLRLADQYAKVSPFGPDSAQRIRDLAIKSIEAYFSPENITRAVEATKVNGVIPANTKQDIIYLFRQLQSQYPDADPQYLNRVIKMLEQ